jgi:hypothetical protein
MQDNCLYTVLWIVWILKALKGQCHEMVVEVRPWSGRLAQLRFANPFFCLKIRRLNATAHRVADPSV